MRIRETLPGLLLLIFSIGTAVYSLRHIQVV